MRTRSVSFRNLLKRISSDGKKLCQGLSENVTHDESKVAVFPDSAAAVSPEKSERTRSARELQTSPESQKAAYMGGLESTSWKGKARSEKVKRRSTAPNLQNSQGALEVLVVDDCRVTRLKLSRALGLAGHVMTGVESAEKALELLQQRWDEHASTPESFPGAILIDLNMPGGMSGMDFVEEIRSRYPHIETPLIAHTASKDWEDEGDGDFCLSAYLVDAGFTDYAMKEPHSESLLGLLRTQLHYSMKEKRVNTPM